MPIVPISMRIDFDIVNILRNTSCRKDVNSIPRQDSNIILTTSEHPLVPMNRSWQGVTEFLQMVRQSSSLLKAVNEANYYRLNVTSVSIVVPQIMLGYEIKARVYLRPYSSIVQHKERNGNKNDR